MPTKKKLPRKVNAPRLLNNPATMAFEEAGRSIRKTGRKAKKAVENFVMTNTGLLGQAARGLSKKKRR